MAYAFLSAMFALPIPSYSDQSFCDLSIHLNSRITFFFYWIKLRKQVDRKQGQWYKTWWLNIYKNKVTKKLCKMIFIFLSMYRKMLILMKHNGKKQQAERDYCFENKKKVMLLNMLSKITKIKKYRAI